LGKLIVSTVMEVIFVPDIKTRASDIENQAIASYGPNNPEPIELKEDFDKRKQKDVFHSDLEYINGEA